MNQSSVFTLDKKNNNYGFEDLPKDIYIDTSVWNMIYGSNNTSNSCKMLTGFIGDCIDNGGRLYSSGIVHEELNHIIAKEIFRSKEAELKNLIGKLPRYSNGDKNEKGIEQLIIERFPNVLTDIDNSINQMLQFVEENSIFLEYEETKDFNELVRKLRKDTNYGLGTRDAKHALVAHTYEINSILTCDGDFTYLDNMNVYTLPSEKYNLIKMGRANVFLPFKQEKY